MSEMSISFILLHLARKWKLFFNLNNCFFILASVLFPVSLKW